MIERDGVAGLTHRSVAVAAGVPVTSTTYHFAGLDDLLVDTLTWCADDLAAQMRDALERSRIMGSSATVEVAALLADALGPRRARTAAQYELYLLAARRPALRGAARHWLDVLASLVEHDDEVAFRAFLAGIDGLLVQGLIDDEPPTAAQLRPVVEHLLRPTRP